MDICMYVCMCTNGREAICVLGGIGASGGGDGAGADKGGVVDQARALVRQVICPTEVLRAFPRARTCHGQRRSLGSPTPHPLTRIPPRETQGTRTMSWLISIDYIYMTCFVWLYVYVALGVPIMCLKYGFCLHICSHWVSLYVSFKYGFVYL